MNSLPKWTVIRLPASVRLDAFGDHIQELLVAGFTNDKRVGVARFSGGEFCRLFEGVIEEGVILDLHLNFHPELLTGRQAEG